jgi:hypothetical protein
MMATRLIQLSILMLGKADYYGRKISLNQLWIVSWLRFPNPLSLGWTIEIEKKKNENH